ncbi:MAG TPA: zf-HC2 domain-containing protein [Terriglobales bacterium]|nr:zf-HC2 domain-containing protein [Terriglobales bacterium]
MSCDWTTKIETYVDGELPAEEVRAFDKHVRACPTCAGIALARVQMKRTIQSAGKRFKPSSEFRNRVQQRISKTRRNRVISIWTITPAVLALVLIAVAAMNYLGSRHGQTQQFYGELADLHVSTLASSAPVDVVSSDRHTVKPWFQGKIPFSFDLPEVQNTEFSLIGGRMAYLHQTPGAQLIYAVRKHRISVFIFNDSSLPAEGNPATGKQVSFSTDTWSQGGLRYFAIGDANAADIGALVKLFKTPPTS